MPVTIVIIEKMHGKCMGGTQEAAFTHTAQTLCSVPGRRGGIPQEHTEMLSALTKLTSSECRSR